MTLGVSAGVMGGTFMLLNGAWYTQYERSAFHSFDDSGEWLQMDKAGHFFSGYTLGRWGHAAMARCSGGTAGPLYVGGSMGLIFLTGVEILDGTSAGWGFSWSDMAANVGGAALFVAQERWWKEQRITAKFSAHTTPYSPARPALLGEGLGERILKDYNGQTIWLSANLPSIFGTSKLPPWLNLAVGYGAQHMLTAFPEGQDGRFRQFYLAPDVDFTRIKTDSGFLRTLLFVLNGIKLPLPGIEVDTKGRLSARAIVF